MHVYGCTDLLSFLGPLSPHGHADCAAWAEYVRIVRLTSPRINEASWPAPLTLRQRSLLAPAGRTSVASLHGLWEVSSQETQTLAPSGGGRPSHVVCTTCFRRFETIPQLGGRGGQCLCAVAHCGSDVRQGEVGQSAGGPARHEATRRCATRTRFEFILDSKQSRSSNASLVTCACIWRPYSTESD